MKLRLRSLESKETLRIEVPDSCSFPQLKQTLLSHLFSSSATSQSSLSSLHLSLNRIHDLQPSSPDESLRGLGITSGDLIFYTLNPAAFSTQQTLNPVPSAPEAPQQIQGDYAREEEARVKDRSFQHCESKNLETLQKSALSVKGSTEHDPTGSGNVDFEANLKRKVFREEIEAPEEDSSCVRSMDVDVDADGSVAQLGKRFSEPYFLKRVLRPELSNDGCRHRLLVIAVHTVFLEAGFVVFDTASGMRVDRFHIPGQWPSTAFTTSLRCTFPKLLGDGSDAAESVGLRFQRLGQFVIVYGSLAEGASGPYRVCLDENRFALAIDSMFADQRHEREVFEFWKRVKDGLALPLSIDLCEKAGLFPPPCFMRLPTELKFKILESLHGVDLAKMACVCTELRFLSSSSDLWKKKFSEEFGQGAAAAAETMNWKEKFVHSYECRKKSEKAITLWHGLPLAVIPRHNPRIRDPDLLRFPPMVGGVPSPFGRRGTGGRAFGRHPARRNFSPSCNLGGFNT